VCGAGAGSCITGDSVFGVYAFSFEKVKAVGLVMTVSWAAVEFFLVVFFDGVEAVVGFRSFFSSSWLQ